MPKIRESFTVRNIPDFSLLLTDGFLTAGTYWTWFDVIRHAICCFISRWLVVGVEFLMTDLNLLNFAVLFTFCPREKRLLQVVLRVMALKEKKRALLFCCLFFSFLFQWFYRDASAHFLVFLLWSTSKSSLWHLPGNYAVKWNFCWVALCSFWFNFFPKYCSLLLRATRWVISLHYTMRTANLKTIDEPEVLSPQQRRGHQDTIVESIVSDSYNYFLLY